MTTIAAVKKNGSISISCDSRISIGSQIVGQDIKCHQKIIKIGQSFIGLSGYTCYDQMVRIYLSHRKRPSLASDVEIMKYFIAFWKYAKKELSIVNDQAGNVKTPFLSLGSVFLIANSTGIYCVFDNLSVLKYEKYYAIGSGSEYALGSISANYDTKKTADQISRAAIGSAMEFDKNTGGEIITFAAKASG